MNTVSHLQWAQTWLHWTSIGSGAHSGKMLLVKIVENNKIDDFLGLVRLSKG